MNLEPYNPNVQQFINYYTKQAEGKNDIRHSIQTSGKSMGPRRNDKQYFVISPSQRIVNQAKAVLEETVKTPIKRKRVSTSRGRQRGRKHKKTQLG
jgi:hypothetical protein